MKKAVKKIKYKLYSGDEYITSASNIKEIAKHIGCSWNNMYISKYRLFNDEEDWTFNYKGYNYTIIKLKDE